MFGYARLRLETIDPQIHIQAGGKVLSTLMPVMQGYSINT